LERQYILGGKMVVAQKTKVQPSTREVVMTENANIRKIEEEKKGAIPESGYLGILIQSGGIIFALGILVSAFILVIEILLRYVFNSPTIWAHEVVIFINASAFIYGGLYAIARNGHIRVVLIYDSFNNRLKRIANIAISLICMVATLTFSWAAWLVVGRALWTPQGEFRFETSGSAWNPPTPGLLKLFLLIILLVMAVQFLILSINYMREKG
jgi:C4-dicarboxylate transporter DctQ subunit